jgi:transposase
MVARHGHGKFTLVTEKIGPLPVLGRYIERLHIDSMLSKHIPAGRSSIPPAQCISLLVRNIIMEREPMYGIAEWSSAYMPSLLGVTYEQRASLNDDRIGRALDALYDADRGTMLTELVVGAIREFGIRMDEFHNDSTTVTFSGRYLDADGGYMRGKKSLSIARGHNKDHRPDLKQLLWTLTVSSDGCVPVHYMAMDGNTDDTSTHLAVWNAVRDLKESPDFIYVADSKLCVEDTLRYIDGQKGKFITVLPATRSEDGWFRQHIQSNTVDWKSAGAAGRDCYGIPITFSVAESPIPSSEGFRIVWVWSSQKEKKDTSIREAAIEKAVSALRKLDKSLNSPKSRIRKRETVVEKADESISGAARYVSYEIAEEHASKFRQQSGGRPGRDTVYTKTVTSRFHVKVKMLEENIRFDAKCDGIFPLLTNCTELSAEDVLGKYKQQPMLEKRHEQLKTVYAVMPVLFKSIARIEAFLFVYFTAMLIQALIERQVRLSMKKQKIASLPVYSEGRKCISPTADKLLSAFSEVMTHHLLDRAVSPSTGPKHEG